MDNRELRLFNRVLVKVLRTSDLLLHNLAKCIGLTADSGAKFSVREQIESKTKASYTEGVHRTVYKGYLDHSFVRSIELNMLEGSIHLLRRPILDIGCGDGTFALLLSRRPDVGIDPLMGAVHHASQTEAYRAVVPLGSGGEFPFQKHSLNGAVCNSVVEHIKDLETTIAECGRVLRPGSLLLITTYTDSFTTALQRFFGANEAIRYNALLTHRNLLPLNEWQELLKRYGFEVEDVRYYLPQESVRLQRLLGSSVLHVFELIAGQLVWWISKRWLHDKVVASTNTHRGTGILLLARRR